MWALAGELMSERLDHRRPLWALDLIGPLDDGRQAIVARIHHAMADGISAVRFLDRRALGRRARSRRRLIAAAPRRGDGSARRWATELRRLPGVVRRELGGHASRVAAGPPDRLGPRARLHDRPARRAEADRRLAPGSRDGQRRPPRRRRRRPARLARREEARRAAGAAGADPGQPPPPRRGRRGARQPRLVPERRPAARRAGSARPARPDQRRDLAAQAPRRRAGALRPLPRAGPVQAPRPRSRSASPGGRASSASRSPTCRGRGPRSASRGGPSSASARSPSRPTATRYGSRRSPAPERRHRPLHRPRGAAGVAELAGAIDDSFAELRAAAIKCDRASVTGSDGAEARPQPRLLGDRPPGRRGGRGRPRRRGGRLRLGLGRRVLRLGRGLGARLAGAADRDDQARRGDHAGPGPARRPPRRWPERRSTRSRAAASSSASAPRAPRSPRAGTGCRTRSRGGAPASTSRSCARSSPGEGPLELRGRALPAADRGRHRAGQGAEAQLPSRCATRSRSSSARSAASRSRWRPRSATAGSRSSSAPTPSRRPGASTWRPASPRAGARARTSRSRPRCRSRSTATSTPPAGSSRRACCSTSAGWARRRPTSTSTSPTASASARSPTRSRASTWTASARRPTRRSPTSSSTRPRWSGPRTRSRGGSRSSPAAGVDRLICSPVHMDAGQRLHTIERLSALAGVASPA